MYKLGIGIAFGLLLSGNAAMAACSVPNTLTNGTTADATAVMGNFTSIVGCAAPLASPNFTGTATFGNGWASGTFGVGGLASARLQVTADGVFNVDADSQFSIKSLSNSNKVLMLGYDTTSNYGYIQSVLRGTNATPLYLNPNGASGGTIVIPILANCNPIKADSAGVLNCSSDERLKDILSGYTTGLSAIDRIKPIIYNWKSKSGLANTSPVLGFSAQNVQSAIPQAVSTDVAGHLKLDQEGILAAAVNAIKELHGQVMALAEMKEAARAESTGAKAVDSRVLMLSAAVNELKVANDNQAAEIVRLEAEMKVLKRKVGAQTAQR